MVKKAKRTLEKARVHIRASSDDVLGQMRRNLESLKLRRHQFRGNLILDQKGKFDVRQREVKITEELETLKKREKQLTEKEAEIKKSIVDLERRIEKLSKVYSELEHVLK